MALRDLRALGSPLARLSLTVARETLERPPLPGDVFLLNWPRLSIDQMVVRVTGIDTGTLGAAEWRIEAIEDVFGMSNTVLSPPPPRVEEPIIEPLPPALVLAVEIPYWELARRLSRADLAYLTDTDTYLGGLAAAGGTGQLNWQLATGVSSGDIAAVVGEDYAPLLTLDAALPATESDAVAVPVLIFPNIKEEYILVEVFERRDLSHTESVMTIFTVSATFNGKQIHYQQVANGMVQEHEVPAASSVRFEWQPSRATLAVHCEDQEVRPELAAAFRDVVLGGNGDITCMPIREFHLMGFCTPAMLVRFRKDRIEGIESMEIKTLLVTKPEVRQAIVRGQTVQRRVENALVIRRHRFEERDIYATASQVHGIDDLTDYVVQQVRLSMRIAKTAFRKAHNVSVQITSPNGFNDQSKTDADAHLIFAQLMRLDCARQY